MGVYLHHSRRASQYDLHFVSSDCFSMEMTLRKEITGLDIHC